MLINAESHKSILYSILNAGPQNMVLQTDITYTQFTLKLKTLYHTMSQLSALTTQF